MKIDHTGFCLSQFDTDSCVDCPSVKCCLILYGKEQVQAVLDKMNVDLGDGIGADDEKDISDPDIPLSDSTLSKCMGV